MTNSKGIVTCWIPLRDGLCVLLNNHYTATTDYAGATATTPAVVR
jgi:hypothetical protein